MADKYIPKKAVSGKVLLRNWWNSIVESNFSDIFKAFSGHVAGTADKHSAEHIDYDENTDLKTKIDRKADKTSVDEALEQKADKTSVDAALEEEASQRKSADDSKVDKVKGYGVGHVLTLIGHGKEWSQVVFASGSPNDRVKIPAYTSDLENDSGFADKTSVDEINVASEQNSEALSVLKQRSIPHTKVSGYPISVTDHLDAEQVIDYKVYGNSVQETRSGKNLLHSNVTTLEFPGITLTHDNGTFTLNGTCTTSANFEVGNIVLNAGTYTLSANANKVPISNDYAFVQLYDSKNNKNIVVNNNNALGSVIVTTSSDATFAYRIRINDGVTYDNVILTPQLELGSVATEYEQYGVMPSPEFPSEIKSVGDLVTDEASEYYGKYDIPINMRGKNIFSGLTKGIGLNTTNGSEVTNKDYSVSGYISVNFNVNTNYLISGLPTTMSTLIAAYNINKEFLGRTQSLRTSKKQITSDIFINGTPQATGDVVYLRVMCYANNPAVETVDDIDGCKIQLEIGDTATEYEPYNSGETKHIYLDEPLRKVGDYADYVDFENQKVIRQVEVLDDTGAKTIDESLGLLDTPTEEIITIPELTTLISSVANVSTFTTIKPSNMEVTYYQDINKKIAELQAAITALGGI